jgi:hypothetical protein
MAKALAKGIVFVSYAHADRARVEPLVMVMKKQFNMFWDSDPAPGEVWRRVLAESLQKARCVLGLWTANLTDTSFAASEGDRAAKRGVLLPVKLDANAYIPLGFDRWQHLDVSSWPGRGEKGLEPLCNSIRKFLARPAPKPWSNALPEAQGWVVPQSSGAISGMRNLVGEVRTLGGVLLREDGPVADVNATLGEIHLTYTATLAAIDRFLEPGETSKRKRMKSYLDLSGGSLRRTIDDKRGHCSRILELYGRAGGLREWLAQRTTPDVLAGADQTFARLGTADGDLFESLSRIGDVLGDEASDIANLLLGEQEAQAAKRITAAKRALLPLRRELAAAMSQLQQVEGAMGFVPNPKRRRRRV